MSKIKPDNLQKVLNDYLKNYVEDISEDVEITTDDITKEAVNELKEVSPRGRGSRSRPYYKGWKRQSGRERFGKYTVKIHNATNYQLTHLLEFGHAKRNGGHTKAIPHIRPIEEKYKKLYERKIITAIKRRSKK